MSNLGWATIIGACAFALACKHGARDFGDLSPSSAGGFAGVAGRSGTAGGVAGGGKSGGASNAGVPGGYAGAFANAGTSAAAFGQAGQGDGARCGDHLIQAGEACDNGSQNSDS